MASPVPEEHARARAVSVVLSAGGGAVAVGLVVGLLRPSPLPLPIAGLLWLASGLWLGTVEALLVGVGALAFKRLRLASSTTSAWAWPLLFATATLPSSTWLGRRLFSGAGIRRTALAGWGPWLVVLIGTAAAFASSRLFLGSRSARRGRRASVALAATLATVLGLAGCARIVPPGYAYLWDGAALAAVVGLQAALILGARASGGAGSAKVALVALGLLLVSSAVVLRWPVARNGARDLEHPSGRLAALWQAAIDFDGDGFSPVLGGGDCDDFNASRHPLALEAPGDGIDQDCDGADLTPGEAQARVTYWTSRKEHPVAAGLAPPAAGKRASIVLISVDALRADALARSAGSDAADMLWQSLGEKSVRFRHAYATSSSTRLSLPMLMSSQLQPSSAQAPTLAQQLARAGYRTAVAAFAHPIDFTAEHRLELHPPYDLLAGFASVALVPEEEADRTAFGGGSKSPHDPVVVDRALAALRDLAAAEAPFFLWTHLFDLHQWDEIVPAGEDDPHRYRRAAEASLRQVVRLVAGVRSLVRKPVVVVLVADHGEGLGERGFRHHTRFLYDALVHVPLWIEAPGLAAADVEEPVSLLDVLPTLLSLVGAPAPLDSAGDDVLPLALDPGRHFERGLLLRDNDQVALVRQGWKLLLAPRSSTVELFRLDDDRPTAELSAAEPAIAREMLGLLRASPLRDLPPIRQP